MQDCISLPQEQTSLMSALLLRFALSVFAVFLIIAGLIVLPLPIPFGAIMILIGVTLLVSSSETAASWVRNYRVKNPKINERLVGLEQRLPHRLGAVLRRTMP